MQFIKRVGEPFLKESEIYRKRAEKKKEEAEKTNMQVVEDVEVKGESLVITATNTNNSAATNTCNSTPPKTDKRKKKVEENGEKDKNRKKIMHKIPTYGQIYAFI